MEHKQNGSDWFFFNIHAISVILNVPYPRAVSRWFFFIRAMQQGRIQNRHGRRGAEVSLGGKGFSSNSGRLADGSSLVGVVAFGRREG